MNQIKYQQLLDKMNRYPLLRWTGSIILLILFILRIVIYQGWYVIAYGLFIYLLNLLIFFLSPQVDPEDEEKSELPLSDEVKPFIRKLPEFKFWYSLTRATLISLFLTLFRIFDIPVYWPILLGYFILLFIFTMKQRIQHMIQYKYIPFTVGKKTYQ